MRERPILFSAPMVRALLDGRKTQARQVVTPGKGQRWLTAETLGKVERFEHQRDGWWSMAVGPARRIVHCGHDIDGGHIGSIRCPYGAPGDRLWVRETWCTEELQADEAEDLPAGTDGVRFQADGVFASIENSREASERWVDAHRRGGRWRSPLFMPRWASRITLELTAVRVERLQDITEADAIAEGLESYDCDGVTYWGELNRGHCDPRYAFERLWNDLHPHREDRWLRAGTETTRSPWVWVLEFRRAACHECHHLLHKGVAARCIASDREGLLFCDCTQSHGTASP